MKGIVDGCRYDNRSGSLVLEMTVAAASQDQSVDSLVERECQV